MSETNLDRELIGNIFKNNAGLEFMVLRYVYSDKHYQRFYECKFLESGYTDIFVSGRIKEGNIKDPFSPSLVGVGYLGNILPKYYPKEYGVWKGMIRRCYDVNHMHYNLYGANSVTVCERWHCFENFVNDLPFIEGFDEKLFYNGELNLDKDLKQKFSINKIYSPETCVFLPKRINSKISTAIPCIGINIESGNIIYTDSIRDMSDILSVDPSYIRQSMIKSKLCNGYDIYKLPASIIPAKII